MTGNNSAKVCLEIRSKAVCYAEDCDIQVTAPNLRIRPVKVLDAICLDSDLAYSPNPADF